MRQLNLVALQVSVETLFFIIIRIFAIYTLQIEESCSSNLFDTKISMAFAVIYYLRYVVYYFKRKGLTMPMNENFVIAAEHLN